VLSKLVKEYLVYIILGLILIAFLMLMMHYVFGRHIFHAIRRRMPDKSVSTYGVEPPPQMEYTLYPQNIIDKKQNVPTYIPDNYIKNNNDNLQNYIDRIR